jgi:hypothetical protein
MTDEEEEHHPDCLRAATDVAVVEQVTDDREERHDMGCGEVRDDDQDGDVPGGHVHSSMTSAHRQVAGSASSYTWA